MPLSALLILPVFFAGLCAWQAWGGWKLMKLAENYPDHPRAAINARVGRIKLWVGCGALALNLLGVLINARYFF